MCWSVGEVRGDVEDMESSTHFPTSFHISLTSPTSPLSSPHTSPQPNIFLHISFHIPPMLVPTPQTTKSFPIPLPSILLQTPQNSLYFLILPHTPSPRTPHSYFIIYPRQNFPLFSFIAKLIQQSNTLETLCKFHKTKIKNGNTASKL